MPRLLVIAPSWIGDAVCSQPLLTRLAALHPGALIDVLAPAWVGPVYKRMVEVRGVHANPFGHGELNLGARWALARRLKRDHYDEAVVLPNSLKSALIPWLAGIPLRTGFTGEARFLLLNNRHRLDKHKTPLQVQRYAQLAEPRGTPPAEPLPPLKLLRDTESEAATRRALGAIPTPIVFCPGAEYGPAKRWPARHFAALARRFGSPAAPVLLLGSPKDAAVGEEIAAAAAGCARNLCGRTSLDQAMDLIAMAALVVTNDSGLMHVAAGFHRPTLALFGSSSPAYTPPLSPAARVLSLNLSCSPCFQRECPLGHFDCLNKLLPDQVAAAAQALPDVPDEIRRSAADAPADAHADAASSPGQQA